jgi:Fe-S-cluster containining protein
MGATEANIADDLPMAIVDPSKGRGDTCPTESEIIGLELEIHGAPLRIDVAIRQEQARLADIVPLARAVCSKIIDAVTEKIRGDDGRIACRPGCSACCHYLVPLSIPEAFRLTEEFSTMPEPHQRLTERLWLLTAARVLRRKPGQLVESQTTENTTHPEGQLRTISDWYRELKVLCPFLRERLCSIYENRPVACREYFVEGSENACAGGCGMAERVKMPVRTTEVLGQLASELEGTAVEAVMLPLVLLWHQGNIERGNQTWPGTMMVKRFFEILNVSVSQDSKAAPAPA